MSCDLIPSVAITQNPEWACITMSEKHGYGVFSWHIEKEDAEHNSKIVNGTVLCVDYYNGELLVPSLARKAVDDFLDDQGDIDDGF